jgi:hypothetical protein
MPKSPRTSSITPAARLARLRRANAGCLLLHEGSFSKRHPQVRISIYGATRTSELFVEISNGEKTFTDVVPSPLVWPPMADRVFGIDIADAITAFDRIERLWKRHKAELVRPRPGGHRPDVTAKAIRKSTKTQLR